MGDTDDENLTSQRLWAGHHIDEDTGLTEAKAHWYDSSTGRFISQDPLGFAAGDENLYRYVGNGPGNSVDPTGLIGDGHHLIPQSLWKYFSATVVSVFDDDQPGKTNQLYEARIRNQYYTNQNYSSVNGVSHECYNDAVNRELDSFLARQPKKTTRSTMTKKQAISFLDEIKKSSDFVIANFNKGIQAEADEAARVGAKVYAKYVKILGSDEAFRLAREAASESVLTKRVALNVTAETGGRTLSRVGGKWILRGVPLIGGAVVYLTTGDANAAAQEVCIDVVASPVGIARDGGYVLAAGMEALVESGEVTREWGQAHYGPRTFGSARANQRAIDRYIANNPNDGVGGIADSINSWPWWPHNWW